MKVIWSISTLTSRNAGDAGIKIMRRIPADKEKYDFSFLITEDHLAKYKKEDLINFILEFMQGIDKEISEMKLAIINQSRIAASFFTNSLANNNV